MTTELIRDLGNLIHQHPTISGREFQQACQRAAEGFYEPGDLDPVATSQEVADAMLRALEMLPDLT